LRTSLLWRIVVIPTQVPLTSRVSPSLDAPTASRNVPYVVPVPSLVTEQDAAATDGAGARSIPPTSASTDALEPKR